MLVLIRNMRFLFRVFCATIILLILPIEILESVITAVCELNKRFSWRTIFHSSVIYNVFKRFRNDHVTNNYYMPNNLRDGSDPLVDSYRLFLREVVLMHRRNRISENLISMFIKKSSSKSERREALQSLKTALIHQSLGKYDKALRLLEHAFRLDAENSDILTALGEALENAWIRHIQGTKYLNDPSDFKLPFSIATLPARSFDDSLILNAEHMYTKALLIDNRAGKAKQHQKRLMPIIEEIDQRRFNLIDFKVRRFYKIPETNPGLVRSKVEHYFKHIYHSNAIEGNTLSLAQTRSILETRLAVGGKSLLEQNEVFIADHKPPPPGGLIELMTELVAWVNSEDSEQMHPIELAALTHWKLVYIHPFYDGNGRTARLLMNLLLMRAGIPPAIIRMEDRQAYYQHLKTANDGDVRPFIRFIATCTERTIDEYLDASSDYQSVNDPAKVADDDDTVMISTQSRKRPLLQSEKLHLLTSVDSAAGDGSKHCRNTLENLDLLSQPNIIYLGGG